mgnify:CR=1 FL=1
MNDYVVGQVLFLTSKNTLKIIPVQIIEEVIRTTINGREKTYMVQFPDKDNTIRDIKQLAGQTFSTESDVRNFMISNATFAIDKMLNHALSVRDKTFTNIIKSVNPIEDLQSDELEVPNDIPLSEDVQQSAENDIVSVDLGDGTVAKMDLSQLQKVGLN